MWTLKSLNKQILRMIEHGYYIFIDNKIYLNPHKKVTNWDTMRLCSSRGLDCCFSSLHLVIRDRFHISHRRTVVAIIATDNQPIYSYSVDGLCSPLFSLYGLLTLLPFEHWCSHFSQDHRVLCRNDFLSSAVWSGYVKSTSLHFVA